jgi:sulfur carrier protein
MIRVNDKFEVEWEEGTTVARLLERLNFSFPLVIVSIDGALVTKDEYASRQIPDGAQVKVLHLVAGG